MVLESETGAGGPLPGGSPGRAQGSLAASGLASGRRVLDTCSRSLHEGLFFESVERRTSCRRRPARIPSARELRVGNFGCGGPSVRALLGAMRWARPSPWPTCALSARTSRTFLPGWLTPVDRLCRIRCDSAQRSVAKPGDDARSPELGLVPHQGLDPPERTWKGRQATWRPVVRTLIPPLTCGNVWRKLVKLMVGG